MAHTKCGFTKVEQEAYIVQQEATWNFFKL